MKKIILITGGERSGKSSYAERLAHELSTSPVYMATAKIWDEEFRRRVERHQQNRVLIGLLVEDRWGMRSG